MLNKNEKTPFKVNQIENEKPNVPNSSCILTGYLANSMNGGHNRTIGWKKIMAGEKHREYKLRLNMQLLTPKTPTYQQLYCTVRAYFVPNSRVWKNAEKYTAQKGGTTEIKIKEIPNFGNKKIPKLDDAVNNKITDLTNSEWWRDSFISCYIPRVGDFISNDTNQNNILVMPKVSALPLRGRIAIYNDMERNKEYDEVAQEYNDDEVSNNEWFSYIYGNNYQSDFFTMRAKRPNNYYTDYRTEMQGLEETIPALNNDTTNFTKWADWESKIAEARSEAENAQLNDWQVIAKLRGSQLLTEGKVQKIGEKTFNLNYSAITQNTYNTNPNIQEQFQVMGKQGAYSYTEIEFPIYAGVEFKEEGYVHFIATVWADTVFEKGFDRNELNVTPLEEYRPDLKDEKFDVLKNLETSTTFMDMSTPELILGYKRKFSEYFKLPNIIAGDLTTNNYFQRGTEDSTYNENYQIESQRSFQFFEQDINVYYGDNGQMIGKHIWKDYTDLAINNNQAIKNEVGYDVEMESSKSGIYVKGQNQIYFVGKHICICELPIDEAIKNNFTQWGEH